MGQDTPSSGRDPPCSLTLQVQKTLWEKKCQIMEPWGQKLLGTEDGKEGACQSCSCSLLGNPLKRALAQPDCRG